MMYKFSVALAVALGAQVVLAQDMPVAPKGPPPRFIAVRSVDQAKQEVVFGLKIVVQSPNEEPIMLVFPNGDSRLTLLSVFGDKQTAPTYVERTEGFKVKMKQAKWRNIDSKEVETETVAKRLKPGMMILLSADGALVDAAYLRMFREDTLVCIVPPDELPVAYMPHVGGGVRIKKVGER